MANCYCFGQGLIVIFNQQAGHFILQISYQPKIFSSNIFSSYCYYTVYADIKALVSPYDTGRWSCIHAISMQIFKALVSVNMTRQHLYLCIKHSVLGLFREAKFNLTTTVLTNEQVFPYNLHHWMKEWLRMMHLDIRLTLHVKQAPAIGKADLGRRFLH